MVARFTRRVSSLLGLAAASALLLQCGEEVVASPLPEPTESSGSDGTGGAAAASSSVASSSATGGTVVKAQACPEGEFATGFDAAGTMLCAPIDASVTAALNEGCSLYFGWRDGCNNCGDGPAKWGRVNGESCAVGGGGGENTCMNQTLGALTQPLLGINLDGNVNGDDKFYVGLHCPTLGESAFPGPCEPGELAVSLSDGGYHTCYPLARLATRYVGERCSVYLGWKDSCNGCTGGPAKWGHAEMLSCTNGAGDDGTCATPLLDGRWVTTFGLNTDGDVNGDDTFYAGMHCDTVEGAKESALGACPSGKALVAINADGALVCDSVAPAVAAIVRKNCAIAFGWRDTCEGCTDGPSKWGRTSTEACAFGSGSDSGCETAILGNVSVPLVALSTDGDVNGDDTFYAGFRCEPSP
jgi:hypothetical protein